MFWLQKYSFFLSLIIILGNIYWALNLCHSLCQALFMSYDLYYNPEISYYYYSHSQKRKVRNWEMNYFVWSHTTIKWWNQDWNTGSLTQELVLSTSRCYIAFLISVFSHLFQFESRFLCFHLAYSYLNIMLNISVFLKTVQVSVSTFQPTRSLIHVMDKFLFVVLWN